MLVFPCYHVATRYQSVAHAVVILDRYQNQPILLCRSHARLSVWLLHAGFFHSPLASCLARRCASVRV